MICVAIVKGIFLLAYSVVNVSHSLNSYAYVNVSVLRNPINASLIITDSPFDSAVASVGRNKINYLLESATFRGLQTLIL